MKSSIATGTIARTIILVIALINQVLVTTGHSVIEINDDTITELVSCVFTIVSAICAWWKNNSFTENAILADEHKDLLDKLDKERGNL